jgi:hypothetical protein
MSCSPLLDITGMPRKPTGAALLAEVLIALGGRSVVERFIPGDHRGELVSGCWEGGKTIHVNPAVDVVDTVIHETLHSVRPQWSESYVRNRTSWLMKQLSDAQIQQVYQDYTKRKKTRRGRDATA